MAKRFLKLTVEPTFGMIRNAKKMYEIIEYANGDLYIKLSGIDNDGQKVFHKKIISKGIVEEIIEHLSKTTINVFLQKQFIYDGDFITLEIDDRKNRAKISLSWISQPPDGWQQLSLVTEKIFSLIPE